MKNRRTLYRSRLGWIFGVCRGIADFAEISVFWVRLLAVIGFIFTAGWPLVIVYIVAAIFMKPAPAIEIKSDADWEFHCAYSADRAMALKRLKRKFENMDRRTRRIESIVTDREFDWDRRFRAEG
jgi:phage shock protein C